MNSLLEEHLGYLSDAAKLRAYEAAIAAVVRPGDVVLDLGCGSGVLGLASLRAGAGFVHAIDRTQFIEVARRTFAAAGFAERASFYRAQAAHVTLPERVDLVVCDHVGHFGFDYGILGLLRDAAARFLRPGGIILPAELRLSIAAVESEACRACVGTWGTSDIPADYQWVGAIAAETKYGATLTPAELLSAPATGATFALGEQGEPFLSWTQELVVERNGQLDGVAGWFDCRLAAGVWMTNSPLAADRLKRAQAFLPLAEQVPVTAGTRILVTVMARPDDRLLGWVVELPESGRKFIHSNWNALLTDSDLQQANPSRPAVLSQLGRARQAILGYCDGSRSAVEVEQMMLREHPHLLPSNDAVTALVRRVLAENIES